MYTQKVKSKEYEVHDMEISMTHSGEVHFQLAALVAEYKARIGHRLTQSRLAEVAGVDRATISYLMNNKRIQNPRLEILVKLADFFSKALGRRIAIDDLIGRGRCQSADLPMDYNLVDDTGDDRSFLNGIEKRTERFSDQIRDLLPQLIKTRGNLNADLKHLEEVISKLQSSLEQMDKLKTEVRETYGKSF